MAEKAANVIDIRGKFPSLIIRWLSPKGCESNASDKARDASQGFRGAAHLFEHLLQKRREPVEVRSGDRVYRRRRDKVMELVTVTDLRPDSVGIPHVHFKLAFEEAVIGRVEAGRRV